MNKRSILITGCSTGIGYTAAHGLKTRGWQVFATARKTEDLARLRSEGLDAIALDYASPASVESCAAEVQDKSGGKLFALFNNGAYGQPGALEDISREVLEEQFAANVFGWHQLTNLVLPMMRQRGEGRIVNCSSVLGLVAFKFRGPYNASKYAIEGLSDTLRLELRGTNIKVVTINPGPIRSQFIANAKIAFEKNVDTEHSPFRDLYKRQRDRLDGKGNNRFKLEPEAVLAKLVKALESKNPRAHYYVTTPTYIMAAARRLLPQSMVDAIADRFSEK